MSNVLVSKSPITKGLPIYKSDGSISDYDYYHEVTVEVLENIKGCENQNTIIYKEPGGETEDFIYIMNGVEPLDVDGEYIFFLYDNNTFLNPSTVIAVSDGMVKPSSELVPEVFGNTRSYNGISVDAYIEVIRSELD